MVKMYYETVNLIFCQEMKFGKVPLLAAAALAFTAGANKVLSEGPNEFETTRLVAADSAKLNNQAASETARLAGIEQRNGWRDDVDNAFQHPQLVLTGGLTASEVNSFNACKTGVRADLYAAVDQGQQPDLTAFNACKTEGEPLEDQVVASR